MANHNPSSSGNGKPRHQRPSTTAALKPRLTPRPTSWASAIETSGRFRTIRINALPDSVTGTSPRTPTNNGHRHETIMAADLTWNITTGSRTCSTNIGYASCSASSPSHVAADQPSSKKPFSPMAIHRLRSGSGWCTGRSTPRLAGSRARRRSRLFAGVWPSTPARCAAWS